MADTAKKIEELTPDELRALLAKKDAELASIVKDATETIEELKVQLKVGASEEKPVTVVKYKGKPYRFTNERFIVPDENTGVEIAAKDADDALIKRLVEQGSSLLVEVK